jgi:hypothetical protein
LAFFLSGNYFGYFIQKLGEFPPNLLVALIKGKTTGSIMSGSAKVCPRLCAKNCNVEGDQIGHLSLIDLLSEAHDDFFEKMK